ncbi:MAG TPA: thioredoxin [bacterium]|nr:thioredoxin [bacterium]HQG47209.1 thioredoxin [bacterium]HQI50263.1 thioredoxin [bacterium]HQJ65028.1 thioredoxin [bacterium]
MATTPLTIENFQSTIENNPIVLIDFWAGWCGPCKMFAPTYEAVSAKHSDIVFAKVDTEAQGDLASLFGIQSIPTLAIFRDGILLYREAGAVPEAMLEELIGQVRKLDMDKVRADIAKQEQEQAHEHDCASCAGCGHSH